MPANTPGAPGQGQPVSFRTACGRRIRVSHLAFGAGPRTIDRVSLDISGSSRTENGAWAGLTAEEARLLAAALLLQATACDHGRA